MPGTRHAEVVDQTLSDIPSPRGDLLQDARAVTLVREHGIRAIVTRDTDFGRPPFPDPVEC